MFNPIKGGTKYILYDAFGVEVKCWLPPVGYGLNSITGELEKTDIIKRSSKKDEQYWEREALPEWWDERRAEEEIKQEKDPDYFDPKCEEIRERHWRRRLCGVWFYNNGKLVYITGLHWFVLNWWKFQGIYFSYRLWNMEYFYWWAFCMEDPCSLGDIEITKRKDGKTARAGAIIYEPISRTEAQHGGIQSKTDDDAEEVYLKSIMHPWQKLPDFFRPVYDTSAGDAPKKGMRFFETTKRGKQALKATKNHEKALESFIDFKPANPEAYDGPTLHWYVSDEAGKLKKHDIVERHETVMFCSEIDGEIIGKHHYTTTVEDTESGGGNFKRLVEMSDRRKLDGNGRTQTGLYVWFVPAYKTMFADKFGIPDEIKGRQYFETKRQALKNNPRSLSSFIRKNPFTLAECFRVDADKCIYDSEALNDRKDALAPFDNARQRGNFVWKDGIEDGKVIWEKNKNGKFSICWNFPVREDGTNGSNGMVQRGQAFYPTNTMNFVAACDPFSHSKTQDTNRRSKAAACVKSKYDPKREEDPYNDAIICVYHARPDDVNIFHEDMIKMCVYFGCQILFENNKNNWEAYFIARGYEAFLIKLPGNNGYGIHGNDGTAQRLCDLTELQISNNINKQHFPEILDQWLEFDFANRTPSDLAMASGYVFIADDRWSVKAPVTKSIDVSRLFKQHKISA